MSINPKQWLKELVTFNGDFSSLPTKKYKELFKRDSISQFIRPISTTENSINCNDGYFGFVFECVPHIRAGTKTSETIESILKKLPDDIFMQVHLWGSKNIESIINRWEFDHTSQNETIREAIKSIGDFFREKTKIAYLTLWKHQLKIIDCFFHLKVKMKKNF